MSYLMIAAEVEEIAICCKVEPKELIDALKAGMKTNHDNATMTRVQAAVNEVYIMIDEDITLEDVISASRQFIDLA